jgi:hypothetical protein
MVSFGGKILDHQRRLVSRATKRRMVRSSMV